jgi:hypothetical protein
VRPDEQGRVHGPSGVQSSVRGRRVLGGSRRRAAATGARLRRRRPRRRAAWSRRARDRLAAGGLAQARPSARRRGSATDARVRRALGATGK